MLVQRTVRGILKNAVGAALPNARIVFKIRRNVAAEGIIIPSDETIVHADADGEFSCQLYTNSDSYLPYRVRLPNGQQLKFNLAYGGDTTLDELLNLSADEQIIFGWETIEW